MPSVTTMSASFINCQSVHTERSHVFLPGPCRSNVTVKTYWLFFFSSTWIYSILGWHAVYSVPDGNGKLGKLWI